MYSPQLINRLLNKEHPRRGKSRTPSLKSGGRELLSSSLTPTPDRKYVIPIDRSFVHGTNLDYIKQIQGQMVEIHEDFKERLRYYSEKPIQMANRPSKL